MKHVLLLLIVFTLGAQANSGIESDIIKMFIEVSDGFYSQRENPWSVPYITPEKELWERLKKSHKELEEVKFNKLHIKVDQRAFLYLLKNSNILKVKETPGEKLPLPLLIQKVYYYRYYESDDVDKCAQVMAKNLDDPLVHSVCKDISTYRHINLNGSQLPRRIGEVKNKHSSSLLKNLTQWIIKKENFFYHEKRMLDSIISGTMFLDKGDALEVFSILKSALTKNLEKNVNFEKEIVTYISLLSSCAKSKNSRK